MHPHATHSTVNRCTPLRGCTCVRAARTHLQTPPSLQPSTACGHTQAIKPQKKQRFCCVRPPALCQRTPTYVVVGRLYFEFSANGDGQRIVQLLQTQRTTTAQQQNVCTCVVSHTHTHHTTTQQHTSQLYSTQPNATSQHSTAQRQHSTGGSGTDHGSIGF